jgi:hypothetical protein
LYIPVLPECAFSLGSDLGDSLHGLERRGDEFAVVPDGNVAALLELEGGVLRGQRGEEAV